MNKDIFTTKIFFINETKWLLIRDFSLNKAGETWHFESLVPICGIAIKRC